MSNFVAEFPVKHHTYQTYTCPPDTAGDFVAEFRNTPRMPYCNSPSQFGQLSPAYVDSSPKSNLSGEDDRELYDLLSDKQFSKERITELLQGSILSLIEKLLTGRQIAQVKGHIQVSLCNDRVPISVCLDEVYNNISGRETELEKGLNVRLRDGVSPHGPCVRLQSPDSVISEGDHVEQVQKSHEEISEEGKQMRNYPFGDHVAQNCSAGHLSQDSDDVKTRRDSDEESGYNSNSELGHRSPQQAKKEVPENEEQGYFGQLYPVECCMDESPALMEQEIRAKRESSPEKTECIKSPEGVTVDDADDVVASSLVIDLSVDNSEESAAKLSDSNSRFSEMTSDADVKLARVHADDVKESSTMGESAEETTQGTQRRTEQMTSDVCPENVVPMICMPEEIEEVETEPSSSSDGTDFETDVPVDLSGDNESSNTTSVTPHPQSMIVKLPNGLMCKMCRESLPNSDAVATHAYEKHNLFSCSFCFRAFTAKNNLKRHIRLHTGLRPYKCPHCPHSFARRDDLKGHMLRHDYSKPFRCAVCKKGYTDRACVKNHMAKEHGSRLMHVCPQCGESFDNDDAFSAHKKSHPELKQFSCKVCYFIGNNNLMTMKHSLIHEHSLFSCKPCNAYFADPFDYTQHVRKHKSNSKFTSYVCCFCKMTLSSYEQFVRHEYSHAQGKTYSCKTCKKQFKSKASLQEHSLAHADQTPERSSANDAPVSDCKPSSSGVEHKEKMTTDSPVLPAFARDSSPAIEMSSQNRQETVLDLSSAKTDAYSYKPEDRAEEILDLRVNKPLRAQLEIPGNGPDARNPAGRFCPSPRPVELHRCCVPRNGCTSEFMGNGDETKSTGSESLACESREYMRTSGHSNVLDLPEKSPSPEMVWSRDARDFGPATILVDEIDMEIRENASPDIPQRAYLASRQELKQKMVARSMSGGYWNKSPYRFSPYSRSKIMDLASKFVAARGPLVTVTKPAGVKNVSPSTQDVSSGQRGRSMVPWQMQERKTSNEGSVGEKKTQSLLCNALTAAPDHFLGVAPVQKRTESPFTSQLPTFIKSEPIGERDSPLYQQIPHPSAAPILKTDQNASDVLEARPMNATTTSHRSKVHECDLCKDVFPSFQELENHSVAVHKRYLCEHCGKNFTARPNRDRHVRYHTGERPYKCDLCDQAFFRGDDLKYHRTTRHPSAQPFVCPRCPATFTWSRDLERHIRQSKCKL